MKTLRKLATTNLMLLLAGCFVPVHAAQHVYLRTGSDLICDHQKNLNGQVRLYFTASDDSYIDVSPNEIAGSEAIRTEAAFSADASIEPSRMNSDSHPIAPAPMDLPALLHRAGAEHRLDPDLLASVVRAESGGQVRVVSHAGAEGLMQLMPKTAADLGVRDNFVPEQNVAGGTAYLDALLMYYHENLALALAAYNAGPAAVNRYHGIPPYAETRRYVQRVIHDYNQCKLREARTKTAHAAQTASNAAAGGAPSSVAFTGVSPTR